MAFGKIRIPCPLLFVSSILLGTLQCGYAQSHGYGLAGVTMSGDRNLRGAFRYGIGGGWALAPHVTIGGEVGGIHKGGPGLLLSGNVGVHFQRRVETGADPFVTVGLTGGLSGGETAGWVNFGGGVNYWFRPRLAFRGEFRAYNGPSDISSFSEFRFGISFR